MRENVPLRRRGRPTARVRIAASVVAGAALVWGAAMPNAQASRMSHPAPPVDTVASYWNAVAQTATVSVAKMFQAESMVYMGYESAAVYDAVSSVDHKFEPYAIRVNAPRDASAEAAAAAAAYTVLGNYLPAQQATFDADYATSLAMIPDGQSKTDGIDVGTRVALALISLRADDGRNAPITYTPASAPGVWQPTPPAFAPAQTPWVGQLRPFLLRSADQFLPGPPPALTSRRYARDFNEIKLLGSATSTVRTPEQTDIARFWSTNVTVQYNSEFRRIVQEQGLGIDDATRLFAMGNLVGADSLIACMNAKYHYGFWRPVTAIPAADTDGNPATQADPTWTPLLTTPNHPEYPAAHGCLTSAEASVFAAFFHSRTINVDLDSTVTGTTRHYNTVDDLRTEIVNARLWGGLHFRNSSEVGVRLGKSVASWALARYFGHD
jgi:hypothetical protein